MIPRQLAASAALWALCWAIPHSPGHAASTQTIRKGWVVYEDAILRFEYPKTWKVSVSLWDSSDGKPDKRVWLAEPPSPGKPVPLGSITIIEDLVGNEKRSLEAILEHWKLSSHKLIRGPTAIQPKGGRCLVHTREGRGWMGGVEATIYSECYGKNGHYFWLYCEISFHSVRGKLKPEAASREQVFQYLLATLEFK